MMLVVAVTVGALVGLVARRQSPIIAFLIAFTIAVLVMLVMP